MYTAERKAHYQARYGQWGGQPEGVPPDYARCCVSVMGDISPVSHQCRRKAAHGPEGAYCRQHDPDVVRAKEQAREAAFNERLEGWRRDQKARDHWGTVTDVLRQIAAGHNDPRTLAEETLAKIGERE